MSDVLSPNAQAILLLTAPLVIAGRRARSGPVVEPLGDDDYGRLAIALRNARLQPADLLTERTDDALLACRPVAAAERLRPLLARGFLLAQALEHWHSRAIWVLSRADSGYPARLKQRLGSAAPPLLYGCGDATLLTRGGLGLVGAPSDALVQLCAAESVALVCSAPPVSTGVVVAVLSGQLERAALQRDHRDALLAGRLLFVSPRDPGLAAEPRATTRCSALVAALANATLDVSSAEQPRDAAALAALLAQSRAG